MVKSVGHLVFYLWFFAALSAGAQQVFIVKGKVTDPNGEPIIGAVIKLKEAPEIAVASDFDGNYSLKAKNPGKYTLQISMMSFASFEKSITLENAKVPLIVNADLQDATKEIKTVVIEAKQEKAKDYYFDKLKRNSVTTFDFISSEVLKRTGDANVGAAVARIPGISTNGSFFTVRGIGDRYIRTSINGYKIPTLDPFTNNFKLDIFPASLVDNIVVNKSTNAELPADWSGAYISVETKDFPDNLVVQLETQVGYNVNTNGKPILSGQRSKTDWLGYDNSLREYNHNEFSEVIENPNLFQQMKGLGLEGYYASLGVNDKTPWTTDFEKLGYIQLGLLKLGDINNPAALQSARQAYNKGSYYLKSYQNLNADAIKKAEAFPVNYDLTQRKAPPAFSQAFTIGNTQLLGGEKQLGWVIAGKYSSSIQYDPLSNTRRVSLDANLQKAISFNSDQQFSRENNNWSVLANVAFKFNNNHTLSYLFMPNMIGSFRLRSGEDTLGDQFNRFNRDQFYESRKLNLHQFNYKMYLPGIKLKVDVGASATFGKSNAPDYKRLRYSQDKATDLYTIGGTDAVYRYFRYLDENAYEARIAAEFPIFEKEGLSRKIKFGGCGSYSTRDYNQYNYSVLFSGYFNKAFDPSKADEYFGKQEFGISTDTVNQSPVHNIHMRYNTDVLSSNRTIGYQQVLSEFAALDFAINNKVRLYAGLRAEQANILSDVFKYDSLKYPVNDPRRFEIPGDVFLVNPGKIKANDLFPSASIVYKIYSKENGSVANLRLNYGRSTARPSVRELSETFVYDYELQANVFGNSALKPVYIQNYDIRLEYYYPNSDFISVSAFRKDLRNHIEINLGGPGYTWQNADKSYVMGVEWDARISLLKNLEFRNNVTLIKSETNFVQSALILNGGQKQYIPRDTLRRVMFGQAPFVVNLMLTYTFPKWKTVCSASYNLQGKRLVISSEQPNVLPDIYEMPRHLLDIRIMQPLGRHYQIALSARDLLNAPIQRTYIFKDNSRENFDKFTPGCFYYFTFTYKL